MPDVAERVDSNKWVLYTVTKICEESGDWMLFLCRLPLAYRL